MESEERKVRNVILKLRGLADTPVEAMSLLVAALASVAVSTHRTMKDVPVEELQSEIDLVHDAIADVLNGWAERRFKSAEDLQ